MDLLRLEQQRQALEESLLRLRASLRHWQTYEAELEGFKEEVHATDGEVDFASIAKGYGGSLVNEQEIRDLAGLDMPSPRTGPQILGMVARRQEYVQKNIETVQRQFWDSEAKLEELDFVALTSATSAEGGGGLPLTEIHEELDDDGNVISSRLSQPEVSSTKLVDALRKAGLSEQDIESATRGGDAAVDGGDDVSKHNHPAPMPRSALVENPYKHTSDDVAPHGPPTHDGPSRPPVRKKSVSFTADTKSAPEPTSRDIEDGKKSVSFNDKVAVMKSAPPPDPRSVSFSTQIEEIPAEAAPVPQGVSIKSEPDLQKVPHAILSKPGEAGLETKVEEQPVNDDPVIPEDESEEDARIRREMLDYHLHEVGHVVAQLDLEGGEDLDEYESASASDFASSDHLDEDTPFTSGMSESEDESEDEHGRSKRRVISDAYHKQMQDLEQRLIGNLGPGLNDGEANDADADVNPSDVRRLVIRETKSSESSGNSDTDKKSNSKKRVSFAEALDVADEPTPPPAKAAKHQEETDENVAPISAIVPERSVSRNIAAPSAPTPPKTSRFRQARAAPAPDASTSTTGLDEDGVPTGPPGKILADQLLERPVARKLIGPPSPDDADPIMQRRELAEEYYRRRNDIIRQQGGFKARGGEDENEDEDDGGMGEWMEEALDGKLKRVSRFKAARIRPQ